MLYSNPTETKLGPAVTPPHPRRPVMTQRGQLVREGNGVRNIVTIGSHSLPDFDPFLLFAEFGGNGPKDYAGGFPDHPHRGFETVTYVTEGKLKHHDSRGNQGRLGPGDVQWMTAGSGLLHSEMADQTEGTLRAFQLWINLPARNKMDAPRYQDIPVHRVPSFTQGGVSGSILAGSIFGLSSPIETGATHPIYLDLIFAPGSRITIPLPHDHAAFAYVYEGAVTFEEQTAQSETITVFSEGDALEISADEPAKLLLLAAKPIGEPIVKHGPFVMNTAEEIKQALHDFQAGHFSN